MQSVSPPVPSVFFGQKPALPSLLLACWLAAFSSGCLRNMPADIPGTGEVPRPDVAEKPTTDMLAQAVRREGGDIEAALKSLDVPVARNRNRQIEWIDLSDTPLTADGLRLLLPLRATLRRLSLNHTYVTDEGLAVIAEFSGLTKLQLNRTPISDAGLIHLRKLPQLHELSLRATHVSNAGLKYVGELTELRMLSLSFTDITDAGLAYLTSLQKLHTLLMQDTAITDEAFRHLKKLQGLRFLNVVGCLVTPQGVAAFRKKAPAVQITASFPPQAESGPGE